MRTIRFVILFIATTLVLFFWSGSVQGSTNVCGSINTNTTWTVAGSPYIATCTVSIASAATLTINPGVTVKFNAGYSLTANGRLLAVGTATDPITFTTNAVTPARGGWRAIHFEPGSSTSQLSYVNVMWGGASSDGLIVLNTNTNPGPAMDHITVSESSTNGIKVINGWNPISDSTISNCTTRGITVTGGQIILGNSTVSNNGSYGIYVDVWALSSLTNVTISNNSDYAIGAIRNASVKMTGQTTVTGNGGGTKNAIGHFGGSIDYERTWDSEIPIVVLASTTVTSTGILTINPGATIKFVSGLQLEVAGKLTAVGNASQPITFTTNATTPTRGSWRGIYFEPGSSASQLSYVNVSWGGASGGTDRDTLIRINTNTNPGPPMDHVTVSESSTNGIKMIDGWGGAISDSTISNCTTRGITVMGGQITLNNSTVSNNGSYGIYVDVWALADLTSVTITNNTDFAIGAYRNAGITMSGQITVSGNGAGVKNAIGHLGGSISEERIWDSEIPIVVFASTTVTSTGILTINPGATIKFVSGSQLEIAGKLTAVGNASQPITFTTNATTPTRGSWRGIYFEPGSSASQLSYVNVSWGGASGGTDRDTLVRINTSPGPSMDHLTVTESSTNGIKMMNGWQTNVSDSTISNCTTRGITVTGGALVLGNSTVSNNGSYGIYVDRYSMLFLSNGALNNNVDYAIGSFSTARIVVTSTPSLSGNGGGSKNAIGFVGGGIDGIGTGTTVTWDSEIETVVLGTPTITATGILAIAPGATIKFAPDKFIEVQGTLTAVGSAQQPILFTSNAAVPTAGSWGGFYFRAGSSMSQLKYATLAYAGDPQYGSHLGTVVFDQGFPSLEHVTIADSATYGIKILLAGTATPFIKHCSFVNNGSGAISNDNAATIDARMNFWDSPNGPSGAGPGNGESISTKVTFDPFFSAAPLDPHLFTSVVVINQTFNPAHGVNISIPFETTITGDWTATFKNAIGTVLRTYNGSGQTGTAVWDGRDSFGTLMLDGTYNFELQSTASPSGEIAGSVKGAAIVIDSTKQLGISSFSAAEFFSPNNDGIQDTNSIQAAFNFEDVNWTLNFRNSSNAIVRSTSGQGAGFAYVWDGKDANSSLQPDGGYIVELLIVDGTMNNGANKPATIDTTFPVSQILYPNGGGILSNFYQAGSELVAITANSTDLNHQQWTLERGAGTAPTSWATLQTGTSPASGGPIHLWDTSNLTNGTYSLRLTTWDKAGNQISALTTLTVGNFEVSMNVRQINVATNETVQYTSIVPFALTETLVIKNSDGEIVRTLVNNVPRNAGNHVDTWNGKMVSGAYLPTGGYFYVVTVTDGTNVLTMDQTGQIIPCTACRFVPYETWDPFNNNPLVLTFPINSPPKLLVLAFSPTLVAGVPRDHIAEGCDLPNFCPYTKEYREAGTHTFRWAGVDGTGAFRTDMKGFVMLEQGIEPNVVVVYGTRLNLSAVTASPSMFNPYKGTQSVSFTIASFQNQAVNITATFQSHSSLSILRTINMTGVTPGNVNIPWDGKADNGMWVAPGGYTVTVKITDPIGNTAGGQILTTVRY